MRTFTVINQKGGCGKTTSAINLASAFARSGCRTLLVDLDPQSHCAAGLGIPEQRLDLDVSDALRAPIDQPLNRDRLVWHVSRKLDLLPSRMKLAGLEAAEGGLADQENKELRLRSVLRRLAKIDGHAQGASGALDGRRDTMTDEDPDDVDGADLVYEPGRDPGLYDVCVIDCPPSIGLLSYNAIAAGREVIIPVETSFFSLRGAAKQVQTARSIARRIGMRTHPRLLATMHDPAQPLARDLLDDLRDRFGSGMIPVVIRYDHALKEAASFGQPIDEYAPDSTGTEDYRSLCEWLVEHTHIDRPEPEQPDDPPGSMPDDQGVMELKERDPARALAGSGAGLSRAQELAIRARGMQQAHASSRLAQRNAGGSTSVNAAGLTTGTLEARPPEPLKRSMVPHRPIAIELMDNRIVEPGVLRAPDLGKVRHLLGVRRSSRGVIFIQPCSLGRRVEIAGDFNDWDPAGTEMVLNEELGVFEKHIELPRGDYEYKLVVDGQWSLDPHNPDRVDNGFGGANNIVRIG